MNNLIAMCTKAGFANRIKNLISASFINPNYTVFWPSENFAGLRYSDIFCDGFRETNHISINAKQIRTWRIELPDELLNLLPKGFSDCSTDYKGEIFSSNNQFRSNDFNQNRTIDCEYLKIPQPILDAIKNQFTKIHFCENILSRVHNHLLEMPNKFVGVHARTWIDHHGRNQSWYNFDDFVNVCSYFSDQELFVTSDDPEFIKHLSKTLNRELLTTRRSIQRTHKSWKQNSQDEMLDDIVELLILSKSSTLILSSMSSYSEVAWYFGGCIDDIFFADPDFLNKGKKNHD